MACSLPHTDSEIEALVQRLIYKDKGRQDVLLDLAFQFKDSCAVRDDLRKTYEKCNDISQESRALICTILKESSEKDRKLHLSMYGKAAQHNQIKQNGKGSPVRHCNTRAYRATHHCGDRRGISLKEVASAGLNSRDVPLMYRSLS
ncbi:hypothetical protein Tco_0515499 [Tanacetum coccineum]